MGAEPSRVEPTRGSLVLFLDPDWVTLPAVRNVSPSKQVKHRYYLEIEGARAHAEDWLRQSGFALLEERDADNRHSYQIISDTLASEWPVIRLHARLGQPQVSAGLQPRREVPSIGFTMPWQHYTAELEATDDRRLGWAIVGRLHWSEEHRRLQWGVAFPLAVSHGLSVGAVFQLRLRFGE